MDDFKDFFKDLRDRITSPLFGSFIISWLVCNWELVFLILFNNADTLKKDRYSIIYYSFLNQPTYKLLLFPLIGAGIYLYFYPIVKNEIKLYHATKQAENDHRILEKTRGYSIPLENYIEQLDGFEKEKKSLADQIAEQIQIREQRNDAISKASEMQEKLSKLETSNADLQAELTNIKSLNNSMVNGIWKADLTYEDNTSEIQKWEFEDSVLTTPTRSYLVSDFFVKADKSAFGMHLRFLEANGAARPDEIPVIFKKSGRIWVSAGFGKIRMIMLTRERTNLYDTAA
ncbi:MAG: hypothetical protein EOO19_15200 [Chryseobacterium sp.]|nr:MAG: hypothetical protein EOO19_15200 [Chryseobacterium sp.]